MVLAIENATTVRSSRSRPCRFPPSPAYPELADTGYPQGVRIP